MGWKLRIRCPCCGRNATTYALGHAGTHRVETMRCVKALGWRYGFVWERGAVPGELGGALVRGLAKALVQVLRLVPTPVDLLALAEPDISLALNLVRGRMSATPRAKAQSSAPVATARVAAPVARAAVTRVHRVRTEIVDEEEAA